MYNIHQLYPPINRRKFRGQTSDNMDRWQAEMGRVREEKRREERRGEEKRGEEKRREEKRRGEEEKRREEERRGEEEKRRGEEEKRRGEERRGREEKRREERRGEEKRRGEKRRGEERKRREEKRKKNIKKRKSQKKEDPGARKGKKVAKHCVFQWLVAPEGRKVGSLKRRVRSQLAKWQMKNCTPLWREAHFQVKMYKTHQCRTTFGSWDVEKVHAVVARSTFRGQHVKHTTFSDHFWTFRCRFAWQAQGIVHCAPCQKWAEREGSVAFPKTMAGVGHWRGSGKMHFPWQAQYFRQVEWKNRKTHWYEAVSSAFNFPFLKDVSQNCFVFDVVNFEKWGSLAKLFRCWCCQVQELRKSRSIVSFLMSSSSKIEEASQNNFVFKLADRKTDR